MPAPVIARQAAPNRNVSRKGADAAMIEVRHPDGCEDSKTDFSPGRNDILSDLRLSALRENPNPPNVRGDLLNQSLRH
jgi:hypothetical protein